MKNLGLTEEQRMECVLSKTFRGLHNAPKINKEKRFWEVNHYGGMSTYDSDLLTRLVLSAHFYAVRAEVCSSGPRMVKIRLHCRQREGLMHERHPIIEEAIKDLQNGESF